MPGFEDLSALLLLPDGVESATSPEAWLELATRNLEGFRPHPAVLRHTVSGRSASVEVRRWSKEEYRALTSPGPEGERLLLGADARLTLCSLERIRNLRNRPDERIYDEIFQFDVLEQPSLEHLQVLQRALITRYYKAGFAGWRELNAVQRRRLVAQPAGWQEAAAALKAVRGPEEVETLELFLSEESHPRLRDEVLAAGGKGQLRPGPDVLAFLLARPDWNLNPGLVRLAQSACEDDPVRAWELRAHPNPQVRLRLVDLLAPLPAAAWDPLGWLAQESEDAVRERLRQVLERRSTPAQLVEQLVQESDRDRREALGWLLVHWSRAIEGSQDWGALNKALRYSQLGSENRSRLRRKLAQVGKLSLRGRWL